MPIAGAAANPVGFTALSPPYEATPLPGLEPGIPAAPENPGTPEEAEVGTDEE